MTLVATLVIAPTIGATEVAALPIPMALAPMIGIGATEEADLLHLLPALTIGATEVADHLHLRPALTTGTEVVALRRRRPPPPPPPLLLLLQALTTEAGTEVGAGLHAGVLTST